MPTRKQISYSQQNLHCLSRRTCVFALAIAFLFPNLALAAETPTQPAVDFARDVATIFEQHCLRCHHPENQKGDLSLATSQDLHDLGYLKATDPAASYLVELITSHGGQPPKMPKEGKPLTAEQIATITSWISAGAKWPDQLVLQLKAKADKSWWAFQPLAEQKLPATPGITPDWQKNPIDAFIFASLAKAELTANPRADRRTLIRRVTYDLTGLPPTPEETAAFVNDNSENAYEQLLDRLLASPRYGEHWGRHWLDVVRFGESNGFERNVSIDSLWPFRDYVIRSFNDDKPYDQLVREHLAGDVLAGAALGSSPELEIGTAFLVCGPYDDVGNQDAVQAAQIRANTIDEIVRATSEAFLGLTVGCARCHNHKFDPIAQADYHSLHATFAGVKHGNRTIATPAQRDAHRQQAEPLEKRIAELKSQKEQLELTLREKAKAIDQQLAATWVRPAVQRKGVEDRFESIEAKYIRLTVLSTDEDPRSNQGYKLDEFEVWSDSIPARNVALASQGAKAAGASRQSGDFAEAYSADLTIDGKFGARWLSAGPTLDIEFAKPERIHRVFFSSDREAVAEKDIKALFVGEYVIEASLDGKAWTKIASSADRKPVTAKHREARLLAAVAADSANQTARESLAEIDKQLAAARQAFAAIPALSNWWVGNFSPAPGPFHLFLGGDPQRKGAEVSPASLSVFEGSEFGYKLNGAEAESQRRLALANWIVDARNPLPARVLANRLWHYHFGTGIVDTPSDFGYMGGRPSHPELLDWLASQVHLHQWKLKPLHKLIMMSETYQQASTFRQEAAALDGDARLLWRFPPRRLAAEEVRDTMLAVAGKLDLKMGGPGFRLYKYLQDNVATYVPLEVHGPDTYRRGIYHQNARAAVIDLVSDFDGPDCASASPRRSTTTTPMQALTLLNHQFTVDMAQALAERLQKDAGPESSTQINRAYQLLYSRIPTPDELAACQRLVEQAGLRALCRALLNTSELVYID